MCAVHVSQKGGDKWQIKRDEFSKCVGPNEVIDVRRKIVVALMLMGFFQTDLANFPKDGKTRRIPFVRGIGLDLCGRVLVAKLNDRVALGAVQVVV